MLHKEGIEGFLNPYGGGGTVSRMHLVVMRQRKYLLLNCLNLLLLCNVIRGAADASGEKSITGKNPLSNNKSEGAGSVPRQCDESAF